MHTPRHLQPATLTYFSLELTLNPNFFENLLTRFPPSIVYPYMAARVTEIQTKLKGRKYE